MFIKSKYVGARRFVARYCCFFKDLQQKRKQTNLQITTIVNLFPGIMNTIFDLLQKLNISCWNGFSISFDTFSFLAISFSKISFSGRCNSWLLLLLYNISKCKECRFFSKTTKSTLVMWNSTKKEIRNETLTDILKYHQFY